MESPWYPAVGWAGSAALGVDGWQGRLEEICPAPAAFSKDKSLILASWGRRCLHLCSGNRLFLPVWTHVGLGLLTASPRELGMGRGRQPPFKLNPHHPLLPLGWELGAPGLAAWSLWGHFSRIWVLSARHGCKPGGAWGGKQLQIQQSPCEQSTGKTCKRNEFSRCATFCHWQRRLCGEAQHRASARQARLIPPQHPPLEPDLFGAAGPAQIRTSWRFCIWSIGGLEAGNEAENCHLFVHMFESYPFLASSAACLRYPPCFPSSRLFGITGSWREMCAQT